METAKKGDRVIVHYTGRFENGTIFDTSEGGDPLSFLAGGDEVISGVSEAVLGMQPGQFKTVSIPPDKGYGPRQDGLSQRVERSLLPDGVQVGDPLRAQVDDETLVVWITELTEDSAVIDANHPLAGQTLFFDLELVSIDS